MPIALDQLPDDIDALKSLVADQVGRNEQLQSKVIILQEQLNLALARRYAASSEKLAPDQIRLFDEAEVETQATAPTEDETITVPEYTRRKRGRKKLPEALPRVKVIHDLPDHERVCPHDGNPLAEIGEVTSEQLDIIPAKIQVIGMSASSTLVAVANASRRQHSRRSQFPRVWPLPACWPTSRSRSTRMPCPCTGRRRS